MAKKPVKKPAQKPAKKAAAKSAAKPAAKAKPAKAKPAKATKPAAKTAPKKAVAKSAAKVATKPATSKNKPGKASAAQPVAKIAGVQLGRVKLGGGTTDVTKVFSPLDDRIIIEEVKTELRTAGGLFIPDTASTPMGPREGKVLAVGRGHRDRKGRIRPLDVKLGDTVMFESYMGDALKIGDREVTVLRESQLLGIVNS